MHLSFSMGIHTAVIIIRINVRLRTRNNLHVVLFQITNINLFPAFILLVTLYRNTLLFAMLEMQALIKVTSTPNTA